MPPLLTWVASFVTCGREVSCSFQEAFPSSRMDRTEKQTKKCYHGICHAIQSRHVQDGVVLPEFEANEHWYWQTSCRKHELLSLIGDLNHEAAVSDTWKNILVPSHRAVIHGVSHGSPHSFVSCILTCSGGWRLYTTGMG